MVTGESSPRRTPRSVNRTATTITCIDPTNSEAAPRVGGYPLFACRDGRRRRLWLRRARARARRRYFSRVESGGRLRRVQHVDVVEVGRVVVDLAVDCFQGRHLVMKRGEFLGRQHAAEG